MNIALIIAGGIGNRMGQDIPKQFLNVNEKPVIIYTLEAFQKNPNIDVISVVCIEGWETVLKSYANQFNITKLKHIFAGGDCGQASIRNGVFELKKNYSDDDIVLVHDAIRPLVTDEIIDDCLRVVGEFGNGIACVPCAEAMLQTEDGTVSSACFPRNNLRRTQTPQGFKLGDLVSLHQEAIEKGILNSIASCTLMVELGKKVYFSKGSEKNLKLTTIEDIEIFKALLTAQRSSWLK